MVCREHIHKKFENPGTLDCCYSGAQGEILYSFRQFNSINFLWFPTIFIQNHKSTCLLTSVSGSKVT